MAGRLERAARVSYRQVKLSGALLRRCVIARRSVQAEGARPGSLCGALAIDVAQSERAHNYASASPASCARSAPARR